MHNKSQKTILLVEDQEINWLIGKASLEKYGYSIILADTGEKAIEVIQTIPSIDLVLMDIDLGDGIDGPTAAEIILKIRDIPIVFLSSHTEPEVVEKTERITSYGYVVKNSSITVLDASIKMAFKLFHAKNVEKDLYKKLEHSYLEINERQFAIDQHAIVAITDLTGKITYVNDQFCKISGYSKDELIGNTHRVVNSGHHSKYYFLQMFSTLKKGITWQGEFRNKAKNGSIYWVYGTIVPLRNADGIIDRYFAIRADITKIKKTEEALRKSEEKYRSYVENAPIGVFIADEMGRYMEVNEAASDITGYSQNELLQLSVPEILSDKSLEKGLALFGKVSQLGKGSGELLFKHKNGSDRWWSVNGVKLSETRILGFTLDITDRKNGEAALKNSEQLLNEAQRLALIGSWELNLLTNTLTWSDEIYRIFEIDKEQFDASYNFFLEAVHPDDRDIVHNSYIHSLEIKKPYNITHRICMPDGRIKIVQEQCNTYFNNDGKPLRSVGTVQDITERKKSDDALQESVNFLDKILNTVASPIFVKNDKHQFCLVNNAFCSLLNLPSEKLIGITGYEYFPKEQFDIFIAKDEEVLRTGKESVNEEQLTDGSGSVRTIITRKTLYTDITGKKFLVGVINDITERIHVEEALQESEQMLNEAQSLAHIGSWSWEVGSDEVHWSKELYNITGYNPQLPPPPFSEFDTLYTPESLMLLRKAVEKAVSHGSPYELELKMIRPDGQIRITLTKGKPVRNASGHIMRLYGTVQDITELKQIVENWHNSESLLNTIFDTMSEGLSLNEVVYNELGKMIDYKILKVNKAFYSIADYNHTEVVGALASTLYRLSSNTIQDFFSLLHTQKDISPTEIVSPLNNKIFSFSSSPIVNNKFVVSFRDITKQKQVEKELLESEKHYRNLVENSLIGVSRTTFKGDILYINSTIVRLLEFDSIDEVTSLGAIVRYKYPSQREEMMQLIKEKGYVESFEATILTKKGNERIILFNMVNSGGVLDATLVDITERKQAEVALLESQALLHRAQEMSLVGHFRFDTVANIVDGSDMLFHIFGLTRDNTPFSEFAKVVHPKDQAWVVETIQAAIANETGYDIEHALLMQDGSIKYVHAKSEFAHDPNNGNLLMLGIVQDITERKQAVEALQQEKSFTDNLLNTPLDTIFLFDPESGTPIRWNKIFSKVSGYTDEEIAMMKAPNDFYDERDILSAKKNLTKIFSEGKGIVELPLRTKQGRHIPFEYIISSVKSFEGKNLLLSIGRDITDRKFNEEALIQSEIRFHAIFDQAPLGIALVESKTGKFININPKFCDILGYKEEEILYKSFLEITHPDDMNLSLNQWQFLLDGDSKLTSYEKRYIKKDGSFVWTNLTRVLLFREEENESYHILIAMDITETKQADETLKKYTFELEKLNQTKDKFFNIIAHDLRNPFSGILGIAELLEMKMKEEKMNESIKLYYKYVQMIQSSAQSAFTLLENLLQWARSQTGEISVSHRNISINYLLSHTIPVVSGNAFKKNISIEDDLSDNEMVFADESLVTTILRNLLTNAIKFTKTNGKITISTQRKEEFLEISIIDTGIGIDSNNLDKIFRIDSKFSKMGTANEKGTGLGLILCKEFVEKQGGKIWATSTLGVGSKFTFTLPRGR